MPRAELTITVPEEVWIGDISREHPEATFTILTAFASDETGVALVELAAPDHVAVVSDLVASEDVTDVEVLHRDDTELLARIETARPLLLFPMRESGIPLEFPFTLADGEAVWELTASSDRLSELGRQLEAFGIRFTVDAVRPHVESDHLLTDRQAELMAAAVEQGYYDTPRTATLTELAEDLGMAKSTVSDMLHRAEERIIKEFMGTEGLTAADEPAEQSGEVVDP
ncbi:helix-turn-helix domain-containing protein [Halosegnis sp.]|uniref:helix-turn-helix domain-containing protein n=1 Tax=Halosegnis sp. TaxID=2864959 RepID=UPI0035D41FB3